MLTPARDSEILSLLHGTDEITAYCLVEPEQQAAILRNLADRLAKEGKSIPGMTCATRPE